MSNTPTSNPALRSLIGEKFIFRPDYPPFEGPFNASEGQLVIGNGMEATILEAFEDWNDVKDLTVLYVRCDKTGLSTHLSLREFENPELEART